ncbi:MAG: hypothetical protein ACKO2P_05310 [Planctomycetota bacterium]
MKTIDVSEKIPAEVLNRFFVAREAASHALFWAPTEFLKINGRDGCSAGHAGVIVRENGSVLFYGGKARMLGWEWTDAVLVPPEDLVMRAELDAEMPRLDLNIWRSDRNCHALLRLPLRTKPIHLGEYHHLRGFPSRFRIRNDQFLSVPFDVKVEAIKETESGMAAGGSTRVEGRGLAAEAPGLVTIRLWKATESREDLKLPLTSHRVTCRTACSPVIYVFWLSGSTILVETPQNSSLDEFLSELQPALPGETLSLLPSGRPAMFDLAGQVRGESITDARALILPLTGQRLRFLFPAQDDRSLTLDVPVQTTYSDGHLVLFNRTEGILLAIRSSPTDARRIQEWLGTTEDTFPWDAGFLAFHKPPATDVLPNRVSVPVYFYKLAQRFEAWNAALPFDVDSKSLIRIVVAGRPTYYLKWNAQESPLELIVPELDDRRLRASVLSGQVEDEVAHNDIDHLYHVLNRLRVRNFLTRLFDDLLLLHQQIHASPSISELLDDLQSIIEPQSNRKPDIATAPPRRTEKEFREQLLKKIVLLATSLPELKRNLERLGTFYPYQVLTWDEQWLGRTFGEDAARVITQQARPATITELRSFVRTTQAGIWRSLAEIERILARLEPVYSERMREVRRKALSRQLGVSAAIGVLGSAAGWYIPAVSAVNAVNAVMGAWDLGQQNGALVLDNAEEILRWLQTFSDALVMQIGESDEFLQRFFKRMSVRDRKLVLEHVRKEDQPAALKTIRVALKEQIRVESNSRFCELWDGAPQIRQDLVETLDQLIHQRAHLSHRQFH